MTTIREEQQKAADTIAAFLQLCKGSLKPDEIAAALSVGRWLCEANALEFGDVVRRAEIENVEV